MRVFDFAWEQINRAANVRLRKNESRDRNNVERPDWEMRYFMAWETTTKESTLNKVFFNIFWWFLFVVFAIMAFWYFFQFHWRSAQIGEVAETHAVFRITLGNALRSEDPKTIVSSLVYAYSYYPAGSKYVRPHSPLLPVIEQGRAQTLAVFVQHLEKITRAGFGCDLDRWVKKYGDEQEVYSYESAKEYRELLSLPTGCAMFFVCLCPIQKNQTAGDGLYHEIYQ